MFRNICDCKHYTGAGEPDGSWTVDQPAEEVPAELPEPCLGINFARDGMMRRDWLALIAVHSDAWLLRWLDPSASPIPDSRPGFTLTVKVTVSRNAITSPNPHTQPPQNAAYQVTPHSCSTSPWPLYPEPDATLSTRI
jgi:hypothetical protein